MMRIQGTQTLRQGPGTAVYTYNLCSLEAGKRGSEVQVYPQLHIKFKASLGYIDPVLKEKKEKKVKDKREENHVACR